MSPTALQRFSTRPPKIFSPLQRSVTIAPLKHLRAKRALKERGEPAKRGYSRRVTVEIGGKLIQPHTTGVKAESSHAVTTRDVEAGTTGQPYTLKKTSVCDARTR